MSTYTLPLDGNELQVTTIPSPQGVHAHSVLWGPQGEILGVTRDMHFIGYCTAEVLAREITAYMPELSTWEYLESLGYVCDCD